MSVKKRDRCTRWRSKTVSFRMSPEENALLDSYAKLSGMSKQDYIIHRLLQKEVVVQGNPRVYKALRNQLADVFEELRHMERIDQLDQDWMDRMDMILALLQGLREE